MKRYTLYISLILILLTSNGYYLYFKYLEHNIKHQIKQEIRKGLNEKDLSLIIVTFKNEDKIIWTEKNKEFKYNGAMYDVVKSKIKNGKKYYYCINDKKENRLVTSFLHNSKKRNKILLELKNVLSSKYFSNKFSIKIIRNKTDVYYPEKKQFYKTVYLELNSPPPENNCFI